MEWIVAIAIGVMTGCGVYLILQQYTFSVMLGLVLISNAVNFYIFAMGRLAIHLPPIIEKNTPINPDLYTDPLPQALVLTAIVIGFGMIAYMIVLSLRLFYESDSGRIDEIEKDDPVIFMPIDIDDETDSIFDSDLYND